MINKRQLCWNLYLLYTKITGAILYFQDTIGGVWDDIQKKSHLHLNETILPSPHTETNNNAVVSGCMDIGISLRQNEEAVWTEAEENKPSPKNQLYKEVKSIPCTCTDDQFKILINKSPGESDTKAVAETYPGNEDESVSRAKTGVARVTDPLEFVMNNFKQVCEKYTCIGKNIAGLKQAKAGQMIEAANLWTEASSYSKASFNLGLCYEIGHGRKKNIERAVECYQQAARENHPQAMYNLALIYLGTEEVPSSHHHQGLELLENAAELGLVQAQTYMGYI